MYKRFLMLLPAALMLTSCFKEEPLSMEADILKVNIRIEEPLKVFYNLTDTTQIVPYSGNDNNIVFKVKPNADLTALAPEFEITEGSTIEPASGTVRDFSQGKLSYTVTSEDGEWKRTYFVDFQPYQNTGYYSLDNGHLAENGKYYIWDGLCSANEGFIVARSTAKPDEYPTIFDPDGYVGGCAQLRTVSTGAWGAMTNKRLAAGNLFNGSFDVSSALTQTLRATHFGEPVEKKPLKYCGYYKYKAGPQLQDAKGKPIEGTDSCAIYAVVFKNHDAEGKEVYLTGEDIMTNPLRVGMAKYYDIPQADKWTRFELPFKYWEELDPVLLKNHGYSLVIVCSASHNGDLYQGALDSTLWVDELEVEYEE